MEDRIKKALEIWPDTNAEDWRMVGGAVVHKDAKVDVPESNLQGGFIRAGRVSGNALVYGDALVSGNAKVSGNALVSGNARVYGDALVSGNAKVYGDALVSGNARVYGDALVSGNAKVYGDAWSHSPLQMQGSKHFIASCSLEHISIGCELHTTSDWLINYESIGQKNGYTTDEIEEYRKIIAFVADWQETQKAKIKASNI